MTAAEAVAVFLTAPPREGWEVIIPRRIEASAIHRTRRLPQVVGWRYRPGSHGTQPCGCDSCQAGRYGTRRLREKHRRAEPPARADRQRD
jgi:hypothetical protein